MQLLIVRTKASINLCFMCLQGFLLERKPGDAADIIQVLNQVPTIFLGLDDIARQFILSRLPPPKKKKSPCRNIERKSDC